MDESFDDLALGELTKELLLAQSENAALRREIEALRDGVVPSKKDHRRSRPNAAELERELRATERLVESLETSLSNAPDPSESRHEIQKLAQRLEEVELEKKRWFEKYDEEKTAHAALRSQYATLHSYYTQVTNYVDDLRRQETGETHERDDALGVSRMMRNARTAEDDVNVSRSSVPYVTSEGEEEY